MKSSPSDIKFLTDQFYISSEEAQRILTKYDGDLLKAARSIIFEWPVTLHRH